MVVVVVVTRTVVVVVVVEVVVMLYHNLAMHPGIFLISDVHGLLYSEYGLLLSAISSQSSSALKCYYVVCKDIHEILLCCMQRHPQPSVVTAMFQSVCRLELWHLFA